LGFLAVWARRSRVVAFAALWGVLLILPPLYLPAFIPLELVHDRYLYLPSIGYSILLALAVWGFGKPAGWRRQVALTMLGAVAFAYAALTLRQSAYWADDVSLFVHSFQIGNTNWFAERQLAFALGRTGHCKEALPMLA